MVLGLRAELAVLAAPADLGGDDGAELHVAAHVADADLVGPVEQVVDVVAADGDEVFGVGAVEASAVEDTVRRVVRYGLATNASPSRGFSSAVTCITASATLRTLRGAHARATRDRR